MNNTSKLSKSIIAVATILCAFVNGMAVTDGSNGFIMNKMEPSNFIIWAVLAILLAVLLTMLLTSIHVVIQRKGEPSFLRSLIFIRWSGLAGIFGGLLFILFEYLFVFTHGTSSVPRNATVFGLTNLQYYRISIVWQLLILFALLGLHALYSRRAGRSGNVGSVMALLGITMLVVSTVLQVYIVDPDKYFFSFPVQSGWMLQLLSYPVYATGMVLVSIATLRSKTLPWWSGLVLINGLLPLLSLVFKPYLVSGLLLLLTTQRPDLSSSDLLSDIVSGAISVPYGLSWIFLGWTTAGTRKGSLS